MLAMKSAQIVSRSRTDPFPGTSVGGGIQLAGVLANPGRRDWSGRSEAQIEQLKERLLEPILN